MNKESFITWLKLDCIVLALTGLVSFAASSEAFSGLWLWLFDLVKWPLDGDPAGFSAEAMPLNTILGGVMVGWAVLMYCVTSGPIAEGNVVLTRQMFISVIAWFCVDSTGSYLSHLPGNIVLNLMFLVLFAVPLLALSRTDQTDEQALESK